MNWGKNSGSYLFWKCRGILLLEIGRLEIWIDCCVDGFVGYWNLVVENGVVGIGMCVVLVVVVGEGNLVLY